MRNVLHTFDLRLTHWVQALPGWVKPLMEFGTFIGKPIFVIIVGVIIMLIGAALQNIRITLSGAAALAVFGIGSLLKLLFHRARPLTEYVEMIGLKTYSFPSGHAVGSVVVFGLATYLLWQVLPAPYNYISTVLLTFLIIVIGVSRVYLGAHYPSDVIAGWLLGVIGLVIIILFIKPTL